MDNIPQDLWLLIVSFMNNKTKRQMRLANTKWFNTIKYNEFKLYFAKSEDIPIIFERLSKYSWPIELSICKAKYSELDLILQLPKLTNLKKLNHVGYYGHILNRSLAPTEDQWMQLSTLTNMEDWRYVHKRFRQKMTFNKDGFPPQLWKAFPKLTKWACHQSSFTSILQNLPNLRSVDFSFNFETINTWPFALVQRPERLTALRMSFQGNIESGSEIWKQLTNLKIFEYNNFSSENTLQLRYLTSLECCSVGCKFLPVFENNVWLTKLTLTCPCKAWSTSSIESLTSLKRLRYLQIIDGPSQIDPTQLCLLGDLTQLRQLKIGQQGPEIDLKYLSNLTDLNSLILHSINRSQHLAIFSNLTKLYIDRGEDYNGSYKEVENLVHLKDLVIDKKRGGYIEIENMPDLAKLSQLTHLQITFGLSTNKALKTIKALTNLEALTLFPVYYKERFLSDLTRLRQLHIENSSMEIAGDNEQFWIDLAALTNMENLLLPYIDNDDRLLTFTTFMNLTTLHIDLASPSFTGCHLTALTTLQTVTIFTGNGIVYNEDQLLDSMPYLFRASIIS